MLGTSLLADAGPGPLGYPMAGSAVVAAICLALSLASGGVWLARRRRGRPAASAGRTFLMATGAAALAGSVGVGVLGLWMPVLWVVAVGLLVAGGVLLWKGIRRKPVEEPAAPVAVSDRAP